MNKQELQIIEDYSRTAIEKLNHAFTFLSNPDAGEGEDNIEECVAQARDLQAEAIQELDHYITILATELRIRIERRGVVVSICE